MGKKQGDKKAKVHENKKAPTTCVIEASEIERRRLPALPHGSAVPSVQVSLTSRVGMGRGGTSPQ